MSSIFSKIVSGEIPSHKIAENDDFYAFLDISPLKEGHTLVIPIGVAVVGLEVAHAHIHLIPINSVADMNFANPKLDISQERLAEIAAKINA